MEVCVKDLSKLPTLDSRTNRLWQLNVAFRYHISHEVYLHDLKREQCWL